MLARTLTLLVVLVSVALAGDAAPDDGSAARVEAATRDLASEDVGVRRRAVWELWQLREHAGSASEALARAIGDPDRYVADTAYTTVQRMGAAARKGLEAALEDAGEPLRSRLVPLLVAVLGRDAFAHSDAAVRAAAAQAFKFGSRAIGREAAGPVLLALATKDPVGRVRAAAANALQLFGAALFDDAPAAAGALLARLEEEDDAESRVQLLGAIGAFARTVRDARLEAALVTGAAATDARERSWAVSALAGLGRSPGEAAAAAIWRATEDDDATIRFAALRAVASALPADERSRRFLADALTHADPRFRRTAARGLAAQGPAAAAVASELREAFEVETDRIAQGEIARGLAEAGVRAALPALRLRFAGHEPPDGVAYAICRLAEEVDEKAIAHLAERALSVTGGTAQSLLARLGARAEKAIPALAAALGKTKGPARVDLVLTLGRIGPTARPARAAIEALRGESPDLDAAIDESLRRIGE